MRWPLGVTLPAAFALALFTAIPAASSDILPSPERPTWDQESPPEPEPPPERPLESTLVFGLSVGVIAVGFAIARGRRQRAHATAHARRETHAGAVEAP
jgi:hypothetical protein